MRQVGNEMLLSQAAVLLNAQVDCLAASDRMMKDHNPHASGGINPVLRTRGFVVSGGK
ncbi:hypothetical protein D9M68_942570 [compost metagenome]